MLEDDNADTPARRRQRIRKYVMLVSVKCPFHGVVSQLSFTELYFGPIANAPYLRVEDVVYVIGPDLVQNEA